MNAFFIDRAKAFLPEQKDRRAFLNQRLASGERLSNSPTFFRLLRSLADESEDR